MELIQMNIGSILEILNNNFWQIFMIIVLLTNKKTWKFGITLLMFQMACGFHLFFYIMMFAISFIEDVRCEDKEINNIVLNVLRKNMNNK